VYAVTGLANGDTGDGDVVPVSTTTGASGTAIQVGLIAWYPTAIAITPNGSTAFVADSGDSLYSGPGAVNTVTPINLVTGKAGSAITVGDNPDGIAITPDGTTGRCAKSFRLVMMRFRGWGAGRGWS
jgi:DNA-binding beta-propeller fold protein YncE